MSIDGVTPADPSGCPASLSASMGPSMSIDGVLRNHNRGRAAAIWLQWGRR